MKKALVAGLGIQGVPISYGMHVLGYRVMAVEKSGRSIAKATDPIERLGAPIEMVQADIVASRNTTLREFEPDIVISALPFRLNLELARKCIKHGIRYCDLGGNVDISREINQLAEKSAVAPVMTDLGLAPGIANIIAEMGYQSLGSAESVKIRVGGLPVKPKGMLKYGLTFNPIGLYNEYVGECLVIRDGEIRKVEPLTEVEFLDFEGLGRMEAFNTSGGISHTLKRMLEQGVKECSYKTIRFPGHVDLIRFLLFECKLDAGAFSTAVSNACGFIAEDQVLIDIEVATEGGKRKWSKRSRVLHAESFTAMQKTTGFGAAAVAAIIGDGDMDGKRSAAYADVPVEKFVRNMTRLLPEMHLDGEPR